MSRRDPTPAGGVAGGVPVIGLAGGVGSGKSTVAQILERLGCQVLDADAQVRALLETPAIRDQLVGWWGERILNAHGGLDRAAVASIVFDDESQRQRLERLLHPIVIGEQLEAIRTADPANVSAVVLDVPLLFEAGMDRHCDAVLFVETPEADRLARVSASRGWDKAELARRQANQQPLAEKKAKSDFVIINSGDRADLEGQVRDAFEKILTRSRT
ncbi:MAG: dephospho-CoA kinase [Phycisphaeraceae bacterium]|nr:dephospho-CoA kinase [Phycisphaeraceae bacterium]